MIFFELPDSFVNRPVNIQLIKMMRLKPHLFYDNVRIEAVFGCPPFCIWNCGSVHLPMENISLENIEKIFDVYEAIEIPYRLTFSNRLLEKKHLLDVYGNAIAKAGNRLGNAVIVSMDIMEEYMLRTYKKYTIIQSLCRVYNTFKEVDIATSNYLACVPIWMNNDWDLLSKLKHPENVIILANEYCPVSKCRYCKEHYDEISRFALLQSKEHYQCKHIAWKIELEKNNYLPSHNITPTDYKKYDLMGIHHFKLNGRASTKRQIIDMYCNYFAKEEYYNEVYNLLIQ